MDVWMDAMCVNYAYKYEDREVPVGWLQAPLQKPQAENLQKGHSVEISYPGVSCQILVE